MPWNPLDDLLDDQRTKLNQLIEELAKVNKRINLVAPSTIPHTEERHIVHSLALSQKCFPVKSTVVDFGAGGGFPTLPLAVRFPETNFVAIDAVRKKTEAIRMFARRLGLANLEVWNGRAENWDGTAHYAVSRATAPLVDLWSWFEPVFETLEDAPEGCWPQGLITLKGGDLEQEIADLQKRHPELKTTQMDLEPLLGANYFRHKQIVVSSWA